MAQAKKPLYPPTAKPSQVGTFFRQNLRDELFDDEWMALQELKKFEISSNFDDRFLVACLLSRKLDVKRAFDVLEANWGWRKEKGFESIPDWSTLNKPLMKSGFAYTIPGARSKEGFGIIYGKFSNMIPDHHQNFLQDILRYIIWHNMVGIFLEDIDYHRNGIMFVAEMKDVGWKNIDLQLQRTVNAALMDRFPLKISRVVILNPPLIFKPLYAGCKLFIKKKIMDRIEIIDLDEIFKYIDNSQLSTEFGGSVPFNIESYLDWVDRVLEFKCAEGIPVKASFLGQVHPIEIKLPNKAISEKPKKKKKKIITEETSEEESDSFKPKSARLSKKEPEEKSEEDSIPEKDDEKEKEKTKAKKEKRKRRFSS